MRIVVHFFTSCSNHIPPEDTHLICDRMMATRLK